MNKFLIYLILFLFSIPFIFSENDSDEQPILSDIDNYSNSQLGVSIFIPKDAIVYDKNSMKELSKNGLNLLYSDSNTKSISDSFNYDTIFIYLSRYPLGTPNKSNPILIIQLLDIHLFPGIKTSLDYLEIFKEQFSNTNLKYTYLKENYNVIISCRSFNCIEYGIQFNKILIRQQILVYKSGNWALLALMFYKNDNDLEYLNNIINSLQFSAYSVF